MTLAELGAWVTPGAFAAAGLLAGLVARRLLSSRFLSAGFRSRHGPDDLVVSALRSPVVLSGAILGLYVAADVARLRPEIQALVQQTLLVLVLLSATWALARLAGAAVGRRARGARFRAVHPVR